MSLGFDSEDEKKAGGGARLDVMRQFAVPHGKSANNLPNLV